MMKYLVASFALVGVALAIPANQTTSINQPPPGNQTNSISQPQPGNQNPPPNGNQNAASSGNVSGGGPSGRGESRPMKPAWMDSFKIVNKIKFMCTEDEWLDLHLPEWMQRIVENPHAAFPAQKCFAAKEIAGLLQKVHDEYEMCDPRRLGHFFMAFMTFYHHFCIQGKPEIAACLGELYGPGGLPTCAMKNGMDPISDRNNSCVEALAATEKCAKERFADQTQFPACRKGEAAKFTAFTKDLVEEIDANINPGKRHKMTCRVLAAMFEDEEAEQA